MPMPSCSPFRRHDEGIVCRSREFTEGGCQYWSFAWTLSGNQKQDNTNEYIVLSLFNRFSFSKGLTKGECKIWCVLNIRGWCNKSWQNNIVGCFKPLIQFNLFLLRIIAKIIRLSNREHEGKLKHLRSGQ